MCSLGVPFSDYAVSVNITSALLYIRGRDSSVGKATRYGLDGPGIESRWGGGRFSAHVQTGLGAHAASCTMGTKSFPGVMLHGRGVDPPPLHLAQRLKKAELYLYLLPL